MRISPITLLPISEPAAPLWTFCGGSQTAVLGSKYLSAPEVRGAEHVLPPSFRSFSAPDGTGVSGGNPSAFAPPGAMPPAAPPACRGGKNSQYITLRDPASVAHLPVKVGVNMTGFSNLELLRSLPINMVEIKPDKFNEGQRLILWDDSMCRFVIQEEKFQMLAAFVGEAQVYVQIHFPAKFDRTDGGRERLSIGALRDHERLLNYFECLEDLRTRLGLSEIVVTIHPPYEILNYDYERIANEYGIAHGIAHYNLATDLKRAVEEDHLRVANVFLLRLADMIEGKGFCIRVGVENQAYNSRDSWNVGNKIRDFEIVMAGTSDTIQLTFDTGHSLLSRGDSDSLTFRQLALFAQARGKYVVNYHFHANDGWVEDLDRRSYKADRHCFPTDRQIPGFDNLHLRRCALERVPAMLEINLAKHASGDFLMKGIAGIRERIDVFASSAP